MDGSKTRFPPQKKIDTDIPPRLAGIQINRRGAIRRGLLVAENIARAHWNPVTPCTSLRHQSLHFSTGERLADALWNHRIAVGLIQ